MDVEHYPVRQWSTSRTQDRAVFDGSLAAYRAAGLKVGIYSTPPSGRASSAPHGMACPNGAPPAPPR